MKTGGCGVAQPYELEFSSETADVSFLPALQRRRLSPLARMAFHVGWPLAEMMPAQPLVFCSRHGETPRNLQLLTNLAQREDLSPHILVCLYTMQWLVCGLFFAMTPVR